MSKSLEEKLYVAHCKIAAQNHKISKMKKCLIIAVRIILAANIEYDKQNIAKWLRHCSEFTDLD